MIVDLHVLQLLRASREDHAKLLVILAGGGAIIIASDLVPRGGLIAHAHPEDLDAARRLLAETEKPAKEGDAK